MANRLSWYLPSRTVAAVFLVISVGFIWQWAKPRPIPYDANKWMQAGTSDRFDIRYDMIDDLREKIENMKEANIDELRDLLGLPDSGSRESGALVYYIGDIGDRLLAKDGSFTYALKKTNNLPVLTLSQSGAEFTLRRMCWNKDCGCL